MLAYGSQRLGGCEEHFVEFEDAGRKQKGARSRFEPWLMMTWNVPCPALDLVVQNRMIPGDW